MKRIVVLSIVAVVLAACQTVPVPQREGRIRAVVDIITTAPVEEVVAYSQTPFAFDSELLVLESDLDLLWTRLRAAGFDLKDAEIMQISPLTEDSYAEFAESYEMRIFFEEYLSADGAVVRVRNGSGEYLLLLNDSRKRTPLLYGLKGPLS
ncbi:MAG: hypothetical protein EA428_09480 [Spirochaetaceae bacterium]|nr:MAG: hypothetical protein EA428_09480 [Spirochaetaceae bacterium]